MKYSIYLFVGALLSACGGSNEAPRAAAAPTATQPAAVANPPKTASAEQVAAEGRRDLTCPPKITTASRTADVPVDDIVGVRPGLTYEEAAALILCSRDLLIVAPETSRGFRLESTDRGVRQGFNARFAEARVEKTSKQILAEMNDAAIARGTNRRIEDVKPGQEKWFVGTMGLPGQERVINVAREEWFAEGKNPTTASVEQALVAKYGPPSLRQENDGLVRLTWAFDPIGRRITETSPLHTRCRMSADPDAGFEISADCGLVIAAAVVPLEDNPAVSRYFQVALADQNGAQEALAATEKGLHDLEASRRAKQAAEASQHSDAPKL